MAYINDIIVHGIPKITNAGEFLMVELNKFYHLFGPIRLLLIRSSPNFVETNYAFLRYENAIVQEKAVEFLNQTGIPHTKIWFDFKPHLELTIELQQLNAIRDELNKRLSKIEAEIQLKVEQQLQQMRDQLEEARAESEAWRARVDLLEVETRRSQFQLNESQELIEELLNQQEHQQITSHAGEEAVREFISTRQLPNPPTTKKHRFTGGQCPICLESFDDCVSIVAMQCGHLSCENCMFKYVQDGDNEMRSRCHSCRAKLGYNYYTRIIYN